MSGNAHSKKHKESQARAIYSTGELFIVATPIGNLGDITLRALEVLKSVDCIACEDTRTSGVLLQHYGITTKRVSYHSHNEAEMSETLLAQLHEGKRIALISDAGTPLLSDPGARLVTQAIEAGVRVTPVPGASALLSALVGGGIASDQFYFGGFLPGKAREREERLAYLRTLPVSLVFYEAPHRLAETLAFLHTALGNRRATLARELTKLHEEYIRGSLIELAARYAANPPKGECVIVVEGAKAVAVSDAEIDTALRAQLKTGSLREAVDEVTAHSKRPRSEVYARALALKNGQA